MTDANAIREFSESLVAAMMFSNLQTPMDCERAAEHVAEAIRIAIRRGKFGTKEAEHLRQRWNLVEAERV